jgi:hypothetical protein
VLSELPGDPTAIEAATEVGLVKTQAEESPGLDEILNEKPEPRPKKIFTGENPVIKRQEVKLLTVRAERFIKREWTREPGANAGDANSGGDRERSEIGSETLSESR